MSEIGDVFVVIRIGTEAELGTAKDGLLPDDIDETWALERTRAELKGKGKYIDVELARKFKEKDDFSPNTLTEHGARRLLDIFKKCPPSGLLHSGRVKDVP